LLCVVGVVGNVGAVGGGVECDVGVIGGCCHCGV